MAEGLPEGLVTTREGVAAVVEGEDRVEAEQVAACWRIYYSNRAVLAENIGQRLQNFFWRIWSSERLRQRLSGTQVNIQFDIINQGGYIRTTPTSSPRSSKSLSAYYQEARRRTPPTTPPAAGSPKQATPAAGSETLSGNGNAEHSSTSLDSEDVLRTGQRPSGFAALSGQNASRDDAVTPRQSSLPALEKSSGSGVSSSHPDPEDSSVTPTPTSPLALLERSDDASKENRRTPQTTSRRPPILKKGSSGSSLSSRSAWIALPSSAESSSRAALKIGEAVSVDDATSLPAQSSSATRRPTATRFNEEVAVSIPKPSTSLSRTTGEGLSRSGAESSQRPGKRNPVVVASSAVSKTKPTFTRQKSNVGGSKGVPSRSSSYQNLARSPRALTRSTTAESQSSLRSSESSEPSSTRKARAASPHSSKQRKQPSPDSPPRQEHLEDPEPEQTVAQKVTRKPTASSGLGKDTTRESSGKQTEVTKPLVDPNFRAKFIDRTRASQRSLTDLSAFARKSSTAVPTSASYQASGMMETVQATSLAGRGKGREAFTNVTAPLKAPAPAGPETADDDTEVPLPRTKSHLTFLLEKENARSQGEERKARRTEP